MNKSNIIQKLVKNYFIYFELTIKLFNIPKKINSISELKKIKRSLKIKNIPNEIFVNDDNDLTLFKYDLNKIKL